MRVQLPFKTSRRASNDSFSSSSSSSHKSTTSHTGPRQSKKTRPPDVPDSWPSRRPPVLRLVTPPSLDTIPPSPLTSSPSPSHHHSRSSSLEHFEDERSFTIRPSPTSTQFSPSVPSFTLPSLTAERRRKMERLRRKLGDNVPLDLVFPSASDSYDSGSSEDTYSFTSSSPSSSPPASPTRRTKLNSRIQNARDSIAEPLSPHRAPRTFLSPKASRPAPRPPGVPFLRTYSQISGPKPEVQAPRTTGGKKLGVIMESPNEHSEGSLQESGMGDAGSGSAAASTRSSHSRESEWCRSDDELQVQVPRWGMASRF